MGVRIRPSKGNWGQTEPWDSWAESWGREWDKASWGCQPVDQGQAFCVPGKLPYLALFCQGGCESLPCGHLCQAVIPTAVAWQSSPGRWDFVTESVHLAPRKGEIYKRHSLAPSGPKALFTSVAYKKWRRGNRGNFILTTSSELVRNLLYCFLLHKNEERGTLTNFSNSEFIVTFSIIPTIKNRIKTSHDIIYYYYYCFLTYPLN